MAAVETAARQSLSFQPDSRVQITDLSPSRDDLQTLFITAQVVLIWPYSSSTRKFSLLLSEADARPLKGRKQVKVTFLNGAARAAQQSRVGIGDSIRLQLRGCQWAQTDDLISTPGKRIEWDIQFRKELAFEVNKHDTAPQHVRYQSTGTPSPVQSPAVNGVVNIIQDLQRGVPKIPLPYLTPIARNASRTSSLAYFDSPLDPFAEDKEFVFGRSKKRTKFARPSGEWQLLNESVRDDIAEVASPLRDRGSEKKSIEIELPGDEAERTATVSSQNHVIDLVSPDIETPSEWAGLATTAPPVVQNPEIPNVSAQPIEEPTKIALDFVKPQTPTRRRERLQLDLDESMHSDAATTPRLMPKPSPGLPLVSPLIRNMGVESSYFPTFDTIMSELEVSGHSEDATDEERRSSVAVSTQRSSNASLVVLDEPPKELRGPIPVSAIGSHVVEDEDMYGAPQSTKVPKDTYDSSPQRARDALDVLEEFLQISPTVPQEPYHIENQAELEVLGGLRPRAEQKIGSSVKAFDKVVTDHDEQRPDSPSHPVDRPHSRQDAGMDSPRPQSRALSFDGAADKDETETEAPEHVKILQSILPDHRGLQSKSLPLETAAQKIHTEVRPAIGDASHALNESQNQLLSPEQTQEDWEGSEVETPPPQSPKNEGALLPTPDNTQSQVQPSSFQAAPSLTEIPIDDTEQAMETMKQEKEPRLSRRVSQRLSRKSDGAENISSPYFTPRKTQVAQPSPIREEPPPRFSASLEEPSSPARRVTRSQKPSPQEPAEEQSIAEADEIESSTAVKLNTSSNRGTKTSLSYYPPLNSLHEHFGQTIDVIALAVDDSSKPERAKSGPKDHHTALRLVDPSVDTKNRTTVQVFRQFRDALPTTHRGDAVILRNFKVQTAKHKWMLLSTDSSAWAVFTRDLTSRSMTDGVKMSGPPVEYGRGETAHVKKLIQWWQEEGEETFSVFSKKPIQTGETNGELRVDIPKPRKGAVTEDSPVIESIEPPPLSPKRTRRRANLTDNFGNEDNTRGLGSTAATPPRSTRAVSRRDNTTPTSVRHQPPRKAKSKTPAPAPAPANSTARNGTASSQQSIVPSTAEKEKENNEDNTSPSAAPTNSPSSTASRRTSGRKEPSLVHELRDGTKYVDDVEGRTAVGIVHELRDGTNYVDQ